MPHEEKDLSESQNDTDKKNDMRVQVVEESPIETKTEENPVSSLSGGDNVSSSGAKRFSDGVPFWILLIAFLIGLTLGGGLVGGMFYFKSNVPEDTLPISESIATPTPQLDQVSESPEPVDVDLTTYKLQVLNGSGVAGAAGVAEDLLLESGFEDITTGNSSTLGFTQTVIQIKEDLPEEVLEKVNASLVQYETETDEAFLEEDSTYDVIITVGTSRS